MSYLLRHAPRPFGSVRTLPRGVRVDEQTLLNRPGYFGGAYVRVLVEDTSAAARRRRRRAIATPRIVLEMADCTETINLEFDITSPGDRENSLFKIDTLLAALHRFRDALAAEADLYARRDADRGLARSREPA